MYLWSFKKINIPKVIKMICIILILITVEVEAKSIQKKKHRKISGILVTESNKKYNPDYDENLKLKLKLDTNKEIQDDKKIQKLPIQSNLNNLQISIIKGFYNEKNVSHKGGLAFGYIAENFHQLGYSMRASMHFYTQDLTAIRFDLNAQYLLDRRISIFAGPNVNKFITKNSQPFQPAYGYQIGVDYKFEISWGLRIDYHTFSSTFTDSTQSSVSVNSAGTEISIFKNF